MQVPQVVRHTHRQDHGEGEQQPADGIGVGEDTVQERDHGADPQRHQHAGDHGHPAELGHRLAVHVPLALRGVDAPGQGEPAHRRCQDEADDGGEPEQQQVDLHSTRSGTTAASSP
ncbi:hypothetical protein ACFFX0_00655 [Citricoccus parietis]|uniref:Uncharacterized protein n=1 Tax=Citricoccus parietis TaxID=592307 RepID=A0ABV5FSY1_9MICC